MSELVTDLEVSPIHRKFTINGARIVKVYDNCMLISVNPSMMNTLDNFEKQFEVSRSFILNKTRPLVKVRIDDKTLSYNIEGVNIPLKEFNEKEKINLIIEAKKLYKNSDSSNILWRIFNLHKIVNDYKEINDS